MRKVIGVLCLIGMVIISGSAFAETWGGEEWSKIVENDGNLVQDGNKLHFTNTNLSNESENFSAYVANNIVLDFSKDFQYSIGFHSLYTTDGDDFRGLDFGIVGITSTMTPVLSAGGCVYISESGSTLYDAYLSNHMYCSTDLMRETFARSINDGYMGIRYTESTDTLEIGLFDKAGNIVAGEEITNFYDDTKLILMNSDDSMRLFLDGESDGTVVTLGEAYFVNFNDMPAGTSTPEPVSTALFLVGGGVMALLRRKH
mgnify:CR=1 FL=1